MHSIVKRLKNDLGDAHLHFAVAKADTVNALERYRGKCRPCYLIYAGSRRRYSATIFIRSCIIEDLMNANEADLGTHLIIFLAI